MNKLNFKAKIRGKEREVRSVCSFENLLFLYQIGAFKNTNNWNKLLVVIGLFLKGRRLKTKLRFHYLEKLGNFTSLEIRDCYGVRLRSANDWLTNMQKQGYVKLVSRTNKPYRYRITERARKLNKVLRKWERDLNEVIRLRKITSLSRLLESLKVRST